jgi:hypothetical protein
MCTPAILVGAVTVISICTSAPAAVIIKDRSFFANKPHTFLDFETKGDGSPVDLPFLGAELFPPDEYSHFGVLFHDGVGRQNLPLPQAGGVLFPEGTIGDALDAVGSWPTAIGSINATWNLEFLIPVHAFGIGVVQDGFPAGPPDPILTSTITAFDAAGDVLGVVRFWDDMIQGGFGGPYGGGVFGDDVLQYQYGFMGLVSNTPIARIEFTHTDFSIFDDLHFSAVPAPGAGVVFVMAGALALRRRRAP